MTHFPAPIPAARDILAELRAILTRSIAEAEAALAVAHGEAAFRVVLMLEDSTMFLAPREAGRLGLHVAHGALEGRTPWTHAVATVHANAWNHGPAAGDRRLQVAIVRYPAALERVIANARATLATLEASA